MDHVQARIRNPGSSTKPRDHEKSAPLRPVQGIGWHEGPTAPVEIQPATPPPAPRAMPMPGVQAMPDWERLVEWRFDAPPPGPPSPVAGRIEQLVAGRLASPAGEWLEEDDEPTDPRVKVPVSIPEESEGLHARFRPDAILPGRSSLAARVPEDDDDIDLLEELDFDDEDEDQPTLRNS